MFSNDAADGDGGHVPNYDRYFNSFVVTTVPEPSTWAMLGVGAVGVGVVALRRRVGRTPAW
jgi:hypothetical protein